MNWDQTVTPVGANGLYCPAPRPQPSPAQYAEAVMSLSELASVCVRLRGPLTLEVELFVSLLIGFAVPAVPAQWGVGGWGELEGRAAEGGKREREKKGQWNQLIVRRKGEKERYKKKSG